MAITGNPYVGPRSFTAAEADRYFGREREARELKALVISQRLVLFYAQSGAGKSSLLNARLIPGLKKEGFFVLPVGRVGGALPQGMDHVANVFVYNLMDSLDMSRKADPATLTGLDLTRFLGGMTSDDDGETWRFDADALAEAQTDAAPRSDPDENKYVSVPTVLIIDQFEEIIINNPDRWPDRAAFFEQLDAAMRADPQLWVVLTMREDFVAALDPYAGLLEDRLRARFYMERMGQCAALQAVQRPAKQAGKPFAPGVAEQLVDNLRQVRAQGQEDVYVQGQYVEPVQLQVVCFQLWESLGDDDKETIHLDDLKRLAEGGDLAKFVDKALGDFYERTLDEVLALDEMSVSERELRTWVERQLITEAGTRGLVFKGDETASGMPNNIVMALAEHYLIRSEIRAGGATWYELVHDRFVEPILANNASWTSLHQSALQRQAALWYDEGTPNALLWRGQALKEAQDWAKKHQVELAPHEKEFLSASIEAAAARKSLRNRVIGISIFLGILGLIFIFMLGIQAGAAAEAAAAEATAVAAQVQAQAQAAYELRPFLEELAQPVASSGIVTGTITTQAGDLWQVLVKPESYITITLTAMGNELNPYLRLYDAGFQIVDEDNNASRASSRSELNNILLTEIGPYFIQTAGCCPDDELRSVGPYKLEVIVKKND